MRTIISFAALFLSVMFLQLGSGGLGPLDVLSGFEFGFSQSQVGLLGSAPFVGFVLGCWWAPRMMGDVGHSRAFAAFTAMGTVGILAHNLTTEPLAWAAFRVLSGMCIAGSYTVVESWLQAKVKNDNRGRAMGLYRAVDTGGSLGAQMMVGVLTPASAQAYTVLAIICCAALLPLTLSRLSQPEIPQAPRLRPRMAWQLSPLAAIGVAVSGLTGGAFRMAGPIYGVEVGLAANQIAFFLGAFVLGGALAQYPAGYIADRYDRRWVLIFFSVLSLVASLLMFPLSSQGGQAVIFGAVFFGLATFPVFSISAAHAHDFAYSDQRVELSAALMFIYALGAIVAPLTVSSLIAWSGPSAMFIFISSAHVLLIFMGLARMLRRPTVAVRTPYVWAPRTTFAMGRLWASWRERKK